MERDDDPQLPPSSSESKDQNEKAPSSSNNNDDPPILPCLPQLQTAVADSRKSLLEEGLITSLELDRLEWMDELGTARKAVLPGELIEKLSLKAAKEKLFRHKNATQIRSFYEQNSEQLTREHQNQHNKISKYFKLRQKLRTSENVEEQLQLGLYPYIDANAGSPGLKELAEFAATIENMMREAMNEVQSEHMHGESSQMHGESVQGESSGAQEEEQVHVESSPEESTE